jgi:hypothetical protein
VEGIAEVNYTSFTPESSVNGHAVPRFSIFKEGSSEKVATLIHCHMENFKVSRSGLPAQICAKDGKVYTAVYDSRFPEGVEEIPVIASFQQHTYGRFAVIRLDKKEGKK